MRRSLRQRSSSSSPSQRRVGQVADRASAKRANVPNKLGLRRRRPTACRAVTALGQSGLREAFFGGEAGLYRAGVSFDPPSLGD
jgi:hypothetical protein